jgi:hypothetical protein
MTEVEVVGRDQQECFENVGAAAHVFDPGGWSAEITTRVDSDSEQPAARRTIVPTRARPLTSDKTTPPATVFGTTAMAVAADMRGRDSLTLVLENDPMKVVMAAQREGEIKPASGVMPLGFLTCR